VGCLGSVKAVASLLFLLLPRSATALAEASRPPASRANAPPAQSSVQSCNTTARSIALVLDASGSMNARLPNGETVARRAVKGVAALVPAGAQLSLRLYGAQSPVAQKVTLRVREPACERVLDLLDPVPMPCRECYCAETIGVDPVCVAIIIDIAQNETCQEYPKQQERSRNGALMIMLVTGGIRTIVVTQFIFRRRPELLVLNASHLFWPQAHHR